MDIFLILIIMFVAFNAFRSYLRGALICIIDTIALLLATILATSFFDQFVYLLYTTDYYKAIKDSVSSMMDYNTIMANNNNTSVIIQNNFVMPRVIQEFVDKNNTVEIYNRIGVKNYDAYITDVFAHLIIVSITFAIVFFIAYVIMYLVKIVAIPRIRVVSLGPVDKYISIGLGVVKSVIFMFLALTFVPLLFTEFNYDKIYSIICNSPILNFLYNLNPIITQLLSDVTLR